jgi:hypothetical protein
LSGQAAQEPELVVGATGIINTWADLVIEHWRSR